MSGKLLVFYLGNDEAYFKTLQRDFKRFTRFDIDLKQLYESEESKIQSLFVKVYKQSPVLVFIDYSNATQDYLHITRLLTRTPLDKKIITVGLVDFLTPPEILEESISAGVDFAHIKQSDAFDVVFDVSRTLAPQDKMQHGFATAKLKEELLAGVPAKVGYIEQQGIHIETDYPLSKGDRVRLKTHLNDKKVFPSQEVFIQATSKSNLFYQFQQNVDAQFLFVDEFHPPEGMESADIDAKKFERLESIEHYKKELHKWIDDNLSRSLEKKAKVLVVDQDFTFYLDQKRTDKHPYTIRCVPYLKDMHEELDRLRPQVIAVSLEKPELPTAKNNVQMLMNLVGELKGKFADLAPFIVIFNTETNSKEFQSLLSYDHVMATGAPFSVDVMVRMAEIFEKKMKKAQVIGVKDEEKVFIKKTNAASNAHIMISVNMTKISETDIYFESDAPFKEGMNLKFTYPVNMYVNIIPNKGQGKVPEYYGLIHALGEADKMELRRFVNSVFFREHDEKVQTESEEFKKLNEKKLAERQEKEALDQIAAPDVDKKGA
jgi:hypothetical protein